MKKGIAVLLAVLLCFGMMACTSNGTDAESKETETVSVDMSQYPVDLNDWSGQNFIDYFKAVGIFTDENGYETWLQDHETYWPETPVDECAGWWSDDGMVMVMIMTLSADNADTSEEQLNEWVASMTENKTLPGDYATVPVDHLVGNVAFTFETTVADEAVYASFNAAYQELLQKMNVTQDW